MGKMKEIYDSRKDERVLANKQPRVQPTIDQVTNPFKEGNRTWGEVSDGNYVFTFHSDEGIIEYRNTGNAMVYIRGIIGKGTPLAPGDTAFIGHANLFADFPKLYAEVATSSPISDPSTQEFLEELEELYSPDPDPDMPDIIEWEMDFELSPEPVATLGRWEDLENYADEELSLSELGLRIKKYGLSKDRKKED